MVTRRGAGAVAPGASIAVIALVLVAGALLPVRAAPHLAEGALARAAASQPARAAPAQLAATVTVQTKVILPETSIAGPGFAGRAIAWTGTDAAHHLNIRVGDGIHFPTKTILPETSPFGPAIAPERGLSTQPYILAWTGTDANHSLNVQLFPGGKKLTLSETTIGAPAIDEGRFNGTEALLLAWTGTDANHSLNVLPLTIRDGITLIPGTKTVLRQFSSNAGPSLLSNVFSKHDVWVLGWTTRTTKQLNLATTPTTGVDFTSELGSGLPQTSATAPTLLAPNELDSCISWTGTDAAHHLNVQCTTFAQFPQFPNPAQTKTVLPETALGTQGAAFGANLGEEGTGLIAWTGTDAAHHLNVAGLQGR